MKSRLTQHLTEQFHPHMLSIIDDTEKHKHHPQSPKTNETHFSVTLVSDMFVDKTRVERSRMVYTALEQEMKHIHALSLTLLTPSEWT